MKAYPCPQARIRRNHRQTICSGWNTSSNFSSVRNPSSTQACLERNIILKRLLGRLGRVFITDIRVKRGDEHEGVVQVVVHLFPVGGDAHGALVVEGQNRLRHQAGGLQEVIRGDGHEHVQFEVALRGGHSHRHVVAHHLHGDHRHRLALRGVDLAGHDGRTGLVLRDMDLAQTVARAGSQPAHVVGDLHHVARGGLDRAVRENDLVLRSERVELVFSRHKGLAGQLRNLLCNQLRRKPFGAFRPVPTAVPPSARLVQRFDRHASAAPRLAPGSNASR